ncbi:M24 family metallopeptidase [Virgibacillus sp. W0181]|uniref:M24 family metallopeptidase n=1 Tax=Virgibacillus sp. W0181 TaxID=3391581 RepID=UPI003F46EC6F
MTEIRFTEDDIRERISNCQQNLNNAEYCGLVLSAEANITYYSNFHTHAPWTTMTRPVFLFIPQSGLPILYVHIFQYPDAKVIAKRCEVRYFESLDGPTAAEIVEIMGDLHMTKGKVGFEKGYEQRIGFTLNTYESLKKELSEAVFADASELIWSQRMIKSKKEIACIKRACVATSYAHDQTFADIKPGMSELEISRMVQMYMLEGGAEHPGFVIMTSGSGNYDRMSKTATDRIISNGDFICLDLGAKYNGYWSDFSRTGFVGKANEKYFSLQQKVHKVTMRTIEHLRPGIRVSDIATICAQEMDKVGMSANFECGRLGHGMGLMSTEPPSVTIYDDTVLEEGMIINLEPGIINELGAFVLEENIVITKEGYEVLSGGSRELHLIK